MTFWLLVRCRRGPFQDQGAFAAFVPYFPVLPRAWVNARRFLIPLGIRGAPAAPLGCFRPCPQPSYHLPVNVKLLWTITTFNICPYFLDTWFVCKQNLGRKANKNLMVYQRLFLSQDKKSSIDLV